MPSNVLHRPHDVPHHPHRETETPQEEIPRRRSRTNWMGLLGLLFSVPALQFAYIPKLWGVALVIGPAAFVIALRGFSDSSTKKLENSGIATLGLIIALFATSKSVLIMSGVQPAPSPSGGSIADSSPDEIVFGQHKFGEVYFLPASSGLLCSKPTPIIPGTEVVKNKTMPHYVKVSCVFSKDGDEPLRFVAFEGATYSGGTPMENPVLTGGRTAALESAGISKASMDTSYNLNWWWVFGTEAPAALTLRVVFTDGSGYGGVELTG